MSVQALQEFRKRLNEDTDLQARSMRAYDQGLPGIVAVGRRSGFDFTEQELQHAIETAGPAEISPVEKRLLSGELTDNELEMASAGSGSPCSVSQGEVKS